MNERDPAEPGSGTSDARISRLSAAILRISQSLDLATVLEEAVESARALTGARSGVITTIDERGEVQDFVTSGLPPEERRKMVEWPDGPRLFEHLRDLPAPLRVADLPGYLTALGLAPNPWGAKTLQGTPMHHRGEHLGHFFLADKEDGEAFTTEDEEILVLFASQAATAIANARTAMSSGHGPTSRRWSRPHRSASWSSTPEPAARSRSTARRGGSPRGSAPRAARRSSCWR